MIIPAVGRHLRDDVRQAIPTHWHAIHAVESKKLCDFCVLRRGMSGTDEKCVSQTLSPD
jgi:hypothetical protein